MRVVLLLPALALCAALVGCGLTAADVTVRRDGFEIRYVSLPDGSREVRYTEISTEREFRAVQNEAGDWSVQLYHPALGVWIDLEHSAKSPDFALPGPPPGILRGVSSK